MVKVSRTSIALDFRGGLQPGMPAVCQVSQANHGRHRKPRHLKEEYAGSPRPATDASLTSSPRATAFWKQGISKRVSDRTGQERPWYLQGHMTT